MKLFLMVMLSFFSAASAFANNEIIENVIYGNGYLKILGFDQKFSVEFCSSGKCDYVKNDLNDSEFKSFFLLGSEDIDGDNVPEIFLSSEGMVNKCNEYHKFDATNLSLDLLKVNDVALRLCNYRRFGDFLISNFRSGPQWNEEIYRVNNGIEFLFKDICTGCDYVKRVYADGRAEMVSQSDLFRDRKKLKIRVVADKTFLYSEPNKKTKMYLIKGDVADVVDYSYGDEEWFDCVYTASNGKKINKWVVATDVEVLSTN